jgi:hypothetical protein
MPDFNVRSDSVNVEQIMEQIRSRIREKRGVDYTEQQIRELAAVKLEKFLDPRGVRSDLLTEFRRGDPDPNYAFEDDTLFRSTRGVIELIRRLLRPLLKLFFNPNPLIHVLHMQSQINDRNASRHQLYYELIHNLVVETTRLGIEVKNLKMRVESLDARVDFNERRARALEGAVIYRPEPNEREEVSRVVASIPPERPPQRQPVPFAPASQPGPISSPPAPQAQGATPLSAESPGQRSKRRRRRRGRRGGAAASALMGTPGTPGSPGSQPAGPDGGASVESAADNINSTEREDASSLSSAPDHDTSPSGDYSPAGSEHDGPDDEQ